MASNLKDPENKAQLYLNHSLGCFVSEVDAGI